MIIAFFLFCVKANAVAGFLKYRVGEYAFSVYTKLCGTAAVQFKGSGTAHVQKNLRTLRV